MKSFILIVICCLMLTACVSVNTSSTNNVEKDAFKPTMDVKLDISGNQVTATVTTNMKIAPEHYGMARESEEGHIHMYLDNGEKIGVKEEQFVIKDLAAGQHTLKVSLHNNDHTPYDVTETVEFEIK